MSLLRKFTQWGRQATIFLLIGGTPLFIMPSAYDSFIIPKVAWIKVLVIMLSLLTFLQWLFLEKGLRFRLNAINASLVFFVFLTVLSLLYAGSKSLARDCVSFTLYLLVFAVLLQDCLMGNKVRIVVLGWLLIFSGMITGVWVLYQDTLAHINPALLHIMPKLSDWRGFLAAGFGNTNHIGDFLALALLLACLFFLYVRRKWREGLVLISVAIIGAGLLVCWSVGSNIGLVAGILAILIALIKFESQRFWKRRLKRLVALVVIALAIKAFYFIPNPLNPHKPSLWQEAFSSARWHAGGPTRLAIWLNTLEIIRQHPLLGIGAGNFTYFYCQVISPIVLRSPTLSPYAGLYTNAAHNGILQTWAELGILGLATLIFVVAVFFWQLIYELKQSGKINLLIRVGLIALMLAFILHAQMNFVLQLPASRLLFFAMLVVPGALLDKNRFGRGRLIPIEFSLRVVSTSVWLEQMKTPRLIEIKSQKISPYLRIVLCVLGIGIGSWLMVLAVRPLVSDIIYKKARVALDMNDWTQAEHYFKKALNIWNDHSDCRSAYSTFLLEQGRYKEAIQQIRKVQERLQASETYYRLGLAYYNLGQFEQAAENWEIFFSRFPRAIHYYPQEYQWLINYQKKE